MNKGLLDQSCTTWELSNISSSMFALDVVFPMHPLVTFNKNMAAWCNIPARHLSRSISQTSASKRIVCVFVVVVEYANAFILIGVSMIIVAGFVGTPSLRPPQNSRNIASPAPDSNSASSHSVLLDAPLQPHRQDKHGVHQPFWVTRMTLQGPKRIKEETQLAAAKLQTLSTCRELRYRFARWPVAAAQSCACRYAASDVWGPTPIIPC